MNHPSKYPVTYPTVWAIANKSLASYRHRDLPVVLANPEMTKDEYMAIPAHAFSPEGDPQDRNTMEGHWRSYQEQRRHLAAHYLVAIGVAPAYNTAKALLA